jgi:hypothetical protein
MNGKITEVKCGCGQVTILDSFDMMVLDELGQKMDYGWRTVMCSKCHKPHKVRISVNLVRDEFKLLKHLSEIISVRDSGTLMNIFNHINEGCTVGDSRHKMIPIMMIVDDLVAEDTRDIMRELVANYVTPCSGDRPWYDFIGEVCDKAYGRGNRTYME